MFVSDLRQVNGFLLYSSQLYVKMFVSGFLWLLLDIILLNVWCGPLDYILFTLCYIG